MYNVPAWWQSYIMGSNRRLELAVDIGAFIDPSAPGDVSFSAGSLIYANPDQLLDGTSLANDPFARFAPSGLPTHSVSGIIAAPMRVETDRQVGMISDVISDSFGFMNWTLVASFTGVHESALVLDFDPLMLPRDFTITFLVGGTPTDVLTVTGNTQAQYQSPMQYFQYDRIEINVTQLNQFNEHARILDVNFGSVLRITNDNLSGESGENHIIYEYDPLGITTPANQLSLKILNLHGEFDADNPNSAFSRITEKNTMVCSIRGMDESGNRTTIPMGTFYIVSAEANDKVVSVVGQDCRYLLMNRPKALSIVSLTPIGSQLEAWLADTGLEYVIDPIAYSRETQVDYTFPIGSNMLSILNTIAQYCSVDVWVSRDGVLHIEDIMGDTTPLISRDTLTEYPNIRIYRPYNYLIVIYNSNGDSVTRDYRDSPDSTAINALTINNPLVNTMAAAEDIITHLTPYMMMFNDRAGVYKGDPALDVGDKVKMETRFSTENLPDTMITKLDYSFDGSFRCSIGGRF